MRCVHINELLSFVAAAYKKLTEETVVDDNGAPYTMSAADTLPIITF